MDMDIQQPTIEYGYRWDNTRSETETGCLKSDHKPTKLGVPYNTAVDRFSNLIMARHFSNITIETST